MARPPNTDVVTRRSFFPLFPDDVPQTRIDVCLDLAFLHTDDEVVARHPDVTLSMVQQWRKLYSKEIQYCSTCRPEVLEAKSDKAKLVLLSLIEKAAGQLKAREEPFSIKELEMIGKIATDLERFRRSELAERGAAQPEPETPKHDPAHLASLLR